MAKITVLLGELSGSIAGNTFSRNKAGAYVRQKVTPTDPKSEAQMAVRALFGQNSANFHTLTPLRKSQWNTFANTIFNPFGGRIAGVTYTGHQAYVSLNQRLSSAVNRGTLPTSYSIGGATPVQYNDFKNESLQIAPTQNFPGAIQSSTGNPLNLTLFSANLNATSGVVSINMDMVGDGGGGSVEPIQQNAPVISSPNDNSPVGFLIFGSEPVEQQGLAPVNMYKNLLCAIPSVSELDDTTYTPTGTIAISANAGNVNGITPRKSWYQTGQSMRITVLSFNTNTGQTALIGSKDLQVQ